MARLLHAIEIKNLDPIEGQERVARNAGGWFAYSGFAVVCDRPLEIHGEQVAPAGWGSHCLHRADGPAVVYPDGFAVYCWHGTRVPADLIEEGWDYQRILTEPNAEIRRAAIEVTGWDQFIADAGLVAVDECDDPGNPGARLALYSLPERIYDEPVNVLLCTNATVERDGTQRRYGLTVPVECKTALAAAAWTFDIPADEYLSLERAT